MPPENQHQLLIMPLVLLPTSCPILHHPEPGASLGCLVACRPEFRLLPFAERRLEKRARSKVALLSMPYQGVLKSELIFTGLGEVFKVYLVIGLFLSFGISLVMFLINCYLFLLPGLYESENKQLLKVLIGFFSYSMIMVKVVHNYFVT